MINLYESEIIDILPSTFKLRPEVIAISYAIKNANQRMMDTMDKSLVYASISTLSEKILDVLSVELRSQYYDDNLPIGIKRTIIKNTLYLYSKAGTPAAVEEMINYIFGSGEVVEWFENDGEPGTFIINTTASVDVDIFNKFSELIRRVKNIRSHLLTINLGIKIGTTFHIALMPITCTKMTIK